VISISFSGAFALYPLVQTWATEYNKTHPDIDLTYKQAVQVKD
jgi:ABC-type phosphate transport system substrate-binding protein